MQYLKCDPSQLLPYVDSLMLQNHACSISIRKSFLPRSDSADCNARFQGTLLLQGHVCKTSPSISFLPLSACADHTASFPAAKPSPFNDADQWVLFHLDSTRIAVAIISASWLESATKPYGEIRPSRSCVVYPPWFDSTSMHLFIPYWWPFQSVQPVHCFQLSIAAIKRTIHCLSGCLF